MSVSHTAQSRAILMPAPHRSPVTTPAEDVRALPSTRFLDPGLPLAGVFVALVAQLILT